MFRTSAGVLTKTVSFRYDVFDRRIAKDVDENGDGVDDRGERFVYDGGDLVLKTDAGWPGHIVAGSHSDKMLTSCGLGDYVTFPSIVTG